MVTTGQPRRTKAGPAARIGLALVLLMPLVTGCWPGEAMPPAPTPPPEGPELDLAAPQTTNGPAEVEPSLVDPFGTGLTGVELEAFLAARYEAYWEAYDLARSNAGGAVAGQGPSLEDLAAGEQLEAGREAVAELAARGHVVREAELPAIAGTDADTEHRVRVASVDGPVAQLEVCMVNDDVRVSLADGTVVDEEVWTVESRATMARTAEGWKLIRSRAVHRVRGVGGCWTGDPDRFPD